MTVTKLEMSRELVPESVSQDPLLDVLVIWKEDIVETALKPGTCVDEVDVVTVVVVVEVVDVLTKLEQVKVCAGANDLPLGIIVVAKPKTTTTRRTYLTQTVPTLTNRTPNRGSRCITLIRLRTVSDNASQTLRLSRQRMGKHLSPTQHSTQHNSLPHRFETNRLKFRSASDLS